MTTSEIRWELNSCYDKIKMLNALIRRLNNEIEELNSLYSKISTLLDNFTEEYKTRKQKLSVLNNIPDVKMTKTYCSGMNDIINGSDYFATKSGIITAKSKIKNKIRQLKDQLAEAETNLNNTIRWRNHLEYLLDVAVTDEGDIAKYYY